MKIKVVGRRRKNRESRQKALSVHSSLHKQVHNTGGLPKIWKLQIARPGWYIPGDVAKSG